MLKLESVLRCGGIERPKINVLIPQGVWAEKNLRQHLGFPAPSFSYEKTEARGGRRGFKHRLGYT